jgi:hypothetical protein
MYMYCGFRPVLVNSEHKSDKTLVLLSKSLYSDVQQILAYLGRGHQMNIFFKVQLAYVKMFNDNIYGMID